MPGIILVEDDHAIAKNLILLLQSEGFTVTHVSTRAEASDVLGGRRYNKLIHPVLKIRG